MLKAQRKQRSNWFQPRTSEGIDYYYKKSYERHKEQEKKNKAEKPEDKDAKK